MFSKKPQLAVQTAAPAPSAGPAARLKKLAALPLNNPYIGAAAAGVLLIASLGILIALGDPGAGAPRIRVSLAETGGEGGEIEYADGYGQGLGAGEFDLSGIQMTSIEALESLATPYGGQAVITLPNGQTQTVALGSAANPWPPAPIAGLTQQGSGGLLPMIAADGRTPAQAYARPFSPNGKPKVSIVIGGLGIDPTTTRQAIELLPPEVTLSFALSEADALQDWIGMARAYGHEVLIDLPMEPSSFPQDDPGPNTLLASAPEDETLRKLDVLLASATGYFGVTNYMGSRFLASDSAMAAFSTGLRRRGLAFVDDGTAAQRGGGVPRASADRVIDDQPGVDAIGYQLAQIEQMAQSRGQALGAGFAYPITVRQVAAWAQGLDQRGFQLAPASALTVRR
jgi:polysaccharide deacetylase 2 family uncharacterized protein YibQ